MVEHMIKSILGTMVSFITTELLKLIIGKLKTTLTANKSGNKE